MTNPLSPPSKAQMLLMLVRRILAYIIDIYITVVLMFKVVWFIDAIIPLTEGFGAFLMAVVHFLLYVCFLAVRSLGQRIMGIKFIHTDEGKIPLEKLLLRALWTMWLFGLIPFIALAKRDIYVIDKLTHIRVIKSRAFL